MNTIVHRNLVTLAHMLERLDRSKVAVDPEQYRSVVAHLVQELRQVPHDAGLESVLEGYPSAAELYENLQYEIAGLCRSPLERSLGAEVAARAAIDAARRRS